ncbi:CRISPR-associated protein Cas4 [Ktedonosporobacter rubrisoli]|uniref:CRISPR-associated exonuclease Cas4 n=1 Tax=Ktedonosporobacter rubrisoli TaxID=2509675 RepID=A0A4P6K0D7_KTERU|nr:CRISPR-associated protein Cas4 [Ktedonosporobacter rubrisoli]QBD81494.1 CRISPR-associated protein Cas4 [Ktedonosporobacter rubrisoli]
MISTILFVGGIALLLFSLALLTLLINERRYQRQRLIEERQRTLGLPPGKLVYENIDGQAEPLYSNEYPLVGKPDYIIQLADGRPVPVTLKTTVQDATAPANHHIMQIIAYCLLLEDYFEQAPTHGILCYAEHNFTIDYTPTLRKKVIRLLGEMARCSQQEPPPLQKQKITKCRICAFQPICHVGSRSK